MSDERPTNLTDFRDQQRELSGAGGAKMERFFDEDSTPKGRQEKQRKLSMERALSELERLLLDPAYEAAFQKANDAIDAAQEALDIALRDNARHIADLEDRAPKLADGRAVFLRADGRGETADGEIIPLSVMATLDIPADAPTIDRYNAARDRRRQLGGFADDIDNARRRVHAPNDPLDRGSLGDLTKDMDDIKRRVENTPTLQRDFQECSSAPGLCEDLDLTDVPVLKG